MHRQGDPQRLEHLRGGPHRDERDRDARERAEHRRLRRVLADVRPDERPDQHDDPDDERPRQAGRPGRQRVVRPQVDRQHDHEDDDEHVRHRRPVGHRRDVRSSLAGGEPAREVGVVDVADQGAGRPAPAGSHRRPPRPGCARRPAQAREHQHVDQRCRSRVRRRRWCRRRPTRAARDCSARLVMLGILLAAASTASGEHGEQRRRAVHPAEDPALGGDHLQAHALELGEVGAHAVREHEALVTAVVGLPDGGVHADLGGHARDDQAGDAALAPAARRTIVPWNAPLPGLSITASPASGREVVDDVVAVLAADQDAALRARRADPQRRVAAVELGRRAVRQVGDVPLARVDHGQPDGAGRLEDLLERRDDGAAAG